MKRLETPHKLNCGLIDNGDEKRMNTLRDLKTYIAQCVKAKLGPRVHACIDISWRCSESTESEVRATARHIKKEFGVETVVKSRASGQLSSVRFIQVGESCTRCEDRVDCLMRERLI